MKYEKNIKFCANDEHVFNVRKKPYPASKSLPKWWRDIPVYSGGDKKFDLSPAPNVTVKRCLPTFDVLTSGYIMPLWTDLLVTIEDGIQKVKYNTDVSPIDIWTAKQVSGFELPDGYSYTVYKYLHGWSVRTPPGYSTLFISPVGYPNSPIRSISGIVDTDTLKTDINTPFIIKEDFEGIIESGTPMFQMIPFKRDNWKSSYELQDIKERYFNLERIRSIAISAYGKTMRNLRTYK